MKIFLSFLCIFFLLSSCCNEHDENSGSIVEDYNISNFGRKNFDCLALPDTACIRTKHDFDSIFQRINTSTDCQGLYFPDINFSKYSLLINYKRFSGKAFVHRNVDVDSIKRTVTYFVSDVTCSSWMEYWYESYNLVLVPMIGNDFKVIFK